MRKIFGKRQSRVNYDGSLSPGEGYAGPSGQASPGQQSPSPQQYAPPQQYASGPSPRQSMAPQEQNPNAAAMRAEMFKSTGDDLLSRESYGDAIAMYNQALSLGGANPFVLCNRSFAYMMQSPPNLQKALEDSQGASRVDSRYWKAYLQQGRIHRMMGDARSAANCFLQASEYARGEDKLIVQNALSEALAHQQTRQSAAPEAPQAPQAPQARPVALADQASGISPPPSPASSASTPLPDHYSAERPSYESRSASNSGTAFASQSSAPSTNQTSSPPIPLPYNSSSRTSGTVPTQQRGFAQNRPQQTIPPLPTVSPPPPPTTGRSTSSSFLDNTPTTPTQPISSQASTSYNSSAPALSAAGPVPRQQTPSFSTQTSPSTAQAQTRQTAPSAPSPPPNTSAQFNTFRSPSAISPQPATPPSVPASRSPPTSTPTTPTNRGIPSAGQSPSIASSPRASQPASPPASSTSPTSDRPSTDSAPAVTTGSFASIASRSPQAPAQSTSRTISASPPATVPESATRSPPATTPSTGPPQASYSMADRKPPIPSATQSTTSSPPPIDTAARAPRSPGLTRVDSGAPEPTAAPARQDPTSPSVPARRNPEEASSLPSALEELASPTEDLPGYVPNLTSSDPTIRALSQEELANQLQALKETLAVKNDGSFTVKPYTASGQIDAISLYYVGRNQGPPTARELGLQEHLHASFRQLSHFSLDYFAGTYKNIDLEAESTYDAYDAGTITVMGYNGEYREQQLLLNPFLELHFLGSKALPKLSMDDMIKRINGMVLSPTYEDWNFYKKLIGKTDTELATVGITSVRRESQFNELCMAYEKSISEEAARFKDFSRTVVVSSLFLTMTENNGFQNFLMQMLVGAELLIRVRNDIEKRINATYITKEISAMMVLADQFMKNIEVYKATGVQTTADPYRIVSLIHRSQAEGLVCFAEQMKWPYVEEVRAYMADAYTSIARGGAVSTAVADWLFGIMVPGKIFTYKIMSALVWASPAIRSLVPSGFYNAGVVINQVSYWPRRSVLGRVLGGRKPAQSICGWIGPLPAPKVSWRGWVMVDAPRTTCPVPCQESDMFGRDRNQPESSESIIADLVTADKWIQARAPPAGDTAKYLLKEIQLAAQPASTTVAGGSEALYRATLTFHINDTPTSFVLYNTPIFVSTPKCFGTHTMHQREADQVLAGLVKPVDLKHSYPPTNQFTLIDARADGAESVARAWCAERGRSAVVNRGSRACFACAATLAMRIGLNFNVLILAT